MRNTFLLLMALLLIDSTHALSFELIAHRGVHQTYHRRNLKNETCTATRIDAPQHSYLENTLASIAHSFELGASMVELDIHPTTEENGRPSEMVVFHDWTLDCRTDGSCENGCKCNSEKQCVTHDQPLDYLKSLDIGHGYTHDGGKSYPFRGKYVGEMPTLEEALNLLYSYPGKKLLVNVKDKMPRTVATFLRIIEGYPVELRRRVYFPRGLAVGFDERLHKLEVPDAIFQSGSRLKKCYKTYLLAGLFGHFPEACYNLSMFVPIREDLSRMIPALEGIRFIDILWGWPEEFIHLAHQHGSKVYPSQVDSVEEYERLRDLPVDGLMTNKIEIIAPHHMKSPSPRIAPNHRPRTDSTAR